MKIAIIGTGNVGTTLALAFKKAGHVIIFGVRDPDGEFKGCEFAIKQRIEWQSIEEATKNSEVIVLCTPGTSAAEVSRSLGDLRDKVIIDTMNLIGNKTAAYSNTYAAIAANCNCPHIVECFNTTGFENMADPAYGDVKLNMFVAGDSDKANE